MKESQEFKKELTPSKELLVTSGLVAEKKSETKIEQDLLAGLSEEEKVIGKIIQEGGEISHAILFKKGWVNEVRALGGSYPQEVEDILQKDVVSPEKQPILREYFKKRLGWREPITGAEDKKEKGKKKKTKKQHVKKNKSSDTVDVVLPTFLPKFVSKDLWKNENVGVVSKRELQDLRMWAGVKGADKYWMERLRSELTVLPFEIASIIKKSIGSGKIEPSGYSKFHEYINNRLKVLYFDVVKRNRMETLKDQLKTIDTGGELYKGKEIEGRRKILFDEKRNSFYAEYEDKKIYLGLGDIVSDYAWGLKYAVDDSVPVYMRRALSKRIIVNEARRDLEKMFDRELAKVYGVSIGVGTSHEGFLENPTSWTGRRNFIQGLVAERMVSESLTRASLNHQEIGFMVERSNAIEDTELKYDLKIRRKQKLRGIAIEGHDMPREEYIEEKKKRLGIQLTTDVREERKKHKESQVEEAKTKIGMIRKNLIKKDVDDIVLVAMNLPGILEHVKRWLQEGKPSGGPEQYMDLETKKRILREVIKDFVSLSEEEIEKAVS